jgi:hypothetical protein
MPLLEAEKQKAGGLIPRFYPSCSWLFNVFEMVFSKGKKRTGINPAPTTAKKALALRRGGVYPRPCIFGVKNIADVK